MTALHMRALRDDMLSATLDLLMVAIILVDREGRIVHANRAGVRHLEAGRAVKRCRGRLTASTPGAAIALRVAIAEATGRGRRRPADTGISTAIPDADGRDLAAWVLPLAGGSPDALAAPCSAQAVVFLRGIGDTAALSRDLLARHYGITPAECRVLMSLIEGKSPYEMAGALGCSETTVRTHLQRLFAKTGTRGQPDLIRLAMSALAPASL